MNSKVLYLQPSMEIASRVEERFSDCKNEIEFVITASAYEALELLSEDNYSVFIADSFITDMKLLELVMTVEKRFPDVLMNVCIDLAESKLVPTIANMRNVSKVYLYPWEIDYLVDGVKDTIDAAHIRQDFNSRKSTLSKQQGDFEKTLLSLKETMLRQKYSYNKLKALLNPFLDGTMEQVNAVNSAAGLPMTESSQRFIRLCCEKMLLLMTTIKVDANSFDTAFVRDVASDLPKDDSIVVKSFNSNLTGLTERDKLAVVWFVLWMIIVSLKEQYVNATVTIDSTQISSDCCSYIITANGTARENRNPAIDEYVEAVAKVFSNDFSLERAAGDKYIVELEI